jgi:hypothetical protein
MYIHWALLIRYKASLQSTGLWETHLTPGRSMITTTNLACGCGISSRKRFRQRESSRSDTMQISSLEASSIFRVVRRICLLDYNLLDMT